MSCFARVTKTRRVRKRNERAALVATTYNRRRDVPYVSRSYGEMKENEMGSSTHADLPIDGRDRE